MYYLLDKGTVTAPELAKKFEVSVRTIYRDIDMLSGAGIPVYTTTGHGGGIHLFDNFVLKKSIEIRTGNAGYFNRCTELVCCSISRYRWSNVKIEGNIPDSGI